MKPLKVATAQFENKSGDKAYNLTVINSLAAEASRQGANIIAFHECSITGCTMTYLLVNFVETDKATEAT